MPRRDGKSAPREVVVVFDWAESGIIGIYVNGRCHAQRDGHVYATEVPGGLCDVSHMSFDSEHGGVEDGWPITVWPKTLKGLKRELDKRGIEWKHGRTVRAVAL